MRIFYTAVFAGLGAILGSFANVCIWRLPQGESISWPPSHCVHCNENLRSWHLIPVVSWLALRGRCAFCGGKISLRYPVVELMTALFYALIVWFGQGPATIASSMILTFALVVSVGTDLSHREIPDEISLGASGLLFLVALFSQNWGALLGGVLLFGIMFLIALASRGGMGGGDIKLSLAIGLALGWRLGLVALFVAFLVGGALAIFLLLFRRSQGKNQVPFGPFLAAGGWIALFLGEEIIRFYMHLSLTLWGW